MEIKQEHAIFKPTQRDRFFNGCGTISNRTSENGHSFIKDLFPIPEFKRTQLFKVKFNFHTKQRER